MVLYLFGLVFKTHIPWIIMEKKQKMNSNKENPTKYLLFLKTIKVVKNKKSEKFS